MRRLQQLEKQLRALAGSANEIYQVTTVTRSGRVRVDAYYKPFPTYAIPPELAAHPTLTELTAALDRVDELSKPIEQLRQQEKNLETVRSPFGRGRIEREIERLEKLIAENADALEAAKAQVAELRAEVKAACDAHPPKANPQTLTLLMHEYYWAQFSAQLNQLQDEKLAVATYEIVYNDLGLPVGLYTPALADFKMMSSLSPTNLLRQNSPQKNTPAVRNKRAQQLGAAMATLCLAQQPDIDGNMGTALIDGKATAVALIDLGLAGYPDLVRHELIEHIASGKLPRLNIFSCKAPENFFCRAFIIEKAPMAPTATAYNLGGATEKFLQYLARNSEQVMACMLGFINQHVNHVRLVEDSSCLDDLHREWISSGADPKLLEANERWLLEELDYVKTSLAQANLAAACTAMLTHKDLDRPTEASDRADFVFNLTLGMHQALCFHADAEASIDASDIVTLDSFKSDLAAAMEAAEITDLTAAQLIAAKIAPVAEVAEIVEAAEVVEVDITDTHSTVATRLRAGPVLVVGDDDLLTPSPTPSLRTRAPSSISTNSSGMFSPGLTATPIARLDPAVTASTAPENTPQLSSVVEPALSIIIGAGSSL